MSEGDPKNTDKKAGNRKEAEARHIVSTRLQRFYKDLLSGFEADADVFFRRVLEQQEIRERGGEASRH
jgi:hypothetical protein